LLEREVLGKMSTLMVASQHEQSRRVKNFQRPQVQHALKRWQHNTQQWTSHTHEGRSLEQWWWFRLNQHGCSTLSPVSTGCLRDHQQTR